MGHADVTTRNLNTMTLSIKKMINQILIITISILMIFCSQDKKETNDRRNHNEDELLNQLFWELVLPIPPCIQTDTTMEGNELYWSNYYTMLETKQFEIYLQDTLKKPNNSDYKKIEVPDDFMQLFTKLFTDSTLIARSINLNTYETVFDIKIKTDFIIDSLQLDSFESHKILGLFGFSRISFNEDYSKACFILTVVKNKECKQKIAYFAEKQNDKWKTTNKRIKLY